MKCQDNVENYEVILQTYCLIDWNYLFGITEQTQASTLTRSSIWKVCLYVFWREDFGVFAKGVDLNNKGYLVNSVVWGVTWHVENV